MLCDACVPYFVVLWQLLNCNYRVLLRYQMSHSSRLLSSSHHSRHSPYKPHNLPSHKPHSSNKWAWWTVEWEWEWEIWEEAESLDSNLDHSLHHSHQCWGASLWWPLEGGWCILSHRDPQPLWTIRWHCTSLHSSSCSNSMDRWGKKERERERGGERERADKVWQGQKVTNKL